MSVAHDPSWLDTYRPSFRGTLKLFSKHLYWRYRLPPDMREGRPSIFHRHEHALNVGKPVWGQLLKAYYLLYEPGEDRHLWGQVVCAIHTPAKDAFYHLPIVFNRIHQLQSMDADEMSPEERQFYELLENDLVTHEPRMVPRSLSPNIPCVVVDCAFDRRGLPKGYVERRPLPLMLQFDESDPEAVWTAANIPYTRWPRSLRQLWTRPVPSQARGERPKDEDLTGTHVTGLPPHKLDALEEATLALCWNLRLDEHFLNVGAVTSGRTVEGAPPVPISNHAGDLAILGLLSQAAELRAELELMMKRHLTPEELSHVKIVPMPMHQFEERFGWQMAMLQAVREKDDGEAGPQT